MVQYWMLVAVSCELGSKKIYVCATNCWSNGLLMHVSLLLQRNNSPVSLYGGRHYQSIFMRQALSYCTSAFYYLLYGKATTLHCLFALERARLKKER